MPFHVTIGAGAVADVPLLPSATTLFDAVTATPRTVIAGRPDRTVHVAPESVERRKFESVTAKAVAPVKRTSRIVAVTGDVTFVNVDPPSVDRTIVPY